MNDLLKHKNELAKSSGFTLLEILIALAIFAVIAVISAIGLRTVINTHEKVSNIDDQLRQIIMAITIMRRDISQMIDKPVLNESGSQVESLYIPGKTSLEFTRTGYINPFGMLKRSNLQRVGYIFNDHKIIRLVWSSLNTGSKEKEQKSVLLEGVKSLYISYVNINGKVIDAWSAKTRQNEIFPHAIIFTMRLENMGLLRLVIPIRGRGYEMQ